MINLMTYYILYFDDIFKSMWFSQGAQYAALPTCNVRKI